MSVLNNITIKEYLELESDKSIYDMVLSCTKPTKDIELKVGKGFIKITPKHSDLWDFSYSDIIELKMAFAELKDFDLTSEIARIVYRIAKPEKVFDIGFLNITNGFTWVVEEFTQMLQVEKNELYYEPDDKEKAAGVENLARFGHTPTIDSLTGGNMTRESEILQYPYHKVFLKLCYNRTVNEINKKLAQNVGK